MKRFSTVIVIALLLTSFASCRFNSNASAPPRPTSESALPRSMKGYELYSWEVEGRWYFSLVAGTNRQKSYEEVTSDEVAVEGVEAIKQKLARLPKGEQVIWSARDNPNVTLPPQPLIDELQAFCNNLDISLVVSR